MKRNLLIIVLLLLLVIGCKKKAENKTEDIYYNVNVENLRFRKTSGINGEFIRMLKKGEKLKLISIGEAETINDVEGKWIQVESTNNEIGWCFDSYLSMEEKSSQINDTDEKNISALINRNNTPVLKNNTVKSDVISNLNMDDKNRAYAL